MKRLSRVSMLAMLVMGLGLALSASPRNAAAQVKVGDFITDQNASQAKELVSPGVYRRIENGMTIRVGPTERIDWPPPYKDATEKYSAQVRISPDHRSVVGYVAGQPFPGIDPNDPDAGTKVMWNVAFRPISTDDYDLRFFDCESLYAGKGKPYHVIQYIQVGHYGGYNEVGRTEVEPMPVDPDFLKTNRYFLSLLYPVLAPEDARGVGLIRYRYAQGNKGDDSWTWTPGARRVRRLSEAILGSNTGAQSYNPDDYEGFSAKTENYSWRFLGEKNMLACVNDPQVPPPLCPTDGGASHCPTVWQMRHLYVVEGVARRDRIPSELYGKHVLYVDSEADFVMYQDMYDRKGELWKNYTSWMKYQDRAVPDARVAIYPFKREFQTGSSSNDLQSGFTTVCYHPGRDVPERECWYINMGAVDKSWFTVEAMVKAAP